MGNKKPLITLLTVLVDPGVFNTEWEFYNWLGKSLNNQEGYEVTEVENMRGSISTSSIRVSKKESDMKPLSPQQKTFNPAKVYKNVKPLFKK